MPYLGLMPAEAVRKSVEAVIGDLERIYGSEFYAAFEADKYPCRVQNKRDSSWMKEANTVGINVRAIGDFWSIIPYAMTLPAAQNAIHLLPIFEPGVVSSLYAPSSWNVNPSFFSQKLAAVFPHLDTVEKQLSLTIRLLHLMDKAVGLDVIPHVDRYAEQVLANPSFFEWIQRKDRSITDHSAGLHKKIQSKLYKFLIKRGSLFSEMDFPEDETAFFDSWPENLRLRMMFGERDSYHQRLERRIEMVDLLYHAGYETLPATMGPPYRGIEVDPDPEAKITDEEGRIWLDYKMIKPQKFSRVFGPLTRFKLYEPQDNNLDWALDFERPFVPAWEYVCKHYGQIQEIFDFDFMRGDMSHVQQRPNGVPTKPGDYYDLLGAVKQSVLPQKPYFGYFAESFLAPAGEMAYGNECDHLEASFADTTLGDLQSETVGTEAFVREFFRYFALLRSRRFSPNFSLMTGDKDDPRFDAFYLKGNETRYFISLFLTDMPSYMGMGFECRDPHPTAAPNEHYTKLYVFQMAEGPKTTKGPFHWGQNDVLYQNLLRQKELATMIFPEIEAAKTIWLIPPDETGKSKVISWTQAGQAKYIFVSNLDQNQGCEACFLPFPSGDWRLCFTSSGLELTGVRRENDKIGIYPGECLVWEKLT